MNQPLLKSNSLKHRNRNRIQTHSTQLESRKANSSGQEEINSSNRLYDIVRNSRVINRKQTSRLDQEQKRQLVDKYRQSMQINFIQSKMKKEYDSLKNSLIFPSFSQEIQSQWWKTVFDHIWRDNYQMSDQNKGGQ